MTSIKNRTPAYIMMGLLALHVLMSFFHTAPERYVSDTLRQAGNVYAFPFFKQNWKLFGPDLPTTNYQMILTVEGETAVELIEYFKKDYRTSLFSRYGNTALGLQTWCALIDRELTYGPNFYYQKSTAHLVKKLSDHLFEDGIYKNKELVVVKDGVYIFRKMYNPTKERAF